MESSGFFVSNQELQHAIDRCEEMLRGKGNAQPERQILVESLNRFLKIQVRRAELLADDDSD